MTQRDFVSSSECSRMWSGLEKEDTSLHCSIISNKSFKGKISTHEAAVSWSGRWTLCSFPMNHLKGGRRHTDVPYICRMQNELHLSPTDTDGAFDRALRGCVLTIVDTYVQFDLNQIHHGGHPEKRPIVRQASMKKRVSILLVCRTAASQVRDVRAIQWGQHAPSSKKAVLHNR